MRLLPAGVSTALLLAGSLHGCGPSSCTGFSVSLAASTGGKATPEAAAITFVPSSSPALPRTGWHVTTSDSAGATLVSGSAQLHAVQGTDGTWQIDSGQTCS